MLGVRFQRKAAVWIDGGGDRVGSIAVFASPLGSLASGVPRHGRLFPSVEIAADRQAQTLPASLVRAGYPRIEHSPLARLERVLRNVHRPQHRIVPSPGVTQEQRILDSRPGHSIGASSMGDVIVIGQNQMEQMVDSIVVQDVDIADRLATASRFHVHRRKSFQGGNLRVAI